VEFRLHDRVPRADCSPTLHRRPILYEHGIVVLDRCKLPCGAALVGVHLGKHDIIPEIDLHTLILNLAAGVCVHRVELRHVCGGVASRTWQPLPIKCRVASALREQDGGMEACGQQGRCGRGCYAHGSRAHVVSVSILSLAVRRSDLVYRYPVVYFLVVLPISLVRLVQFMNQPVPLWADVLSALVFNTTGTYLTQRSQRSSILMTHPW
jgi:hypothetical protein